MTMSSTHDAPGSGVAGRLAFAASPAFALMAWIAMSAPSMPMCAPAPGILHMDGMATMYLLMSLFHLPPWLRLGSRRLQARTVSTTQGE